MTVNIEEFQQYLKIDKHNLDEEIVQQPSLLFRVSDELVQANADRDALKSALERTDAELDQELRKDFETSGDKYTEAQVKNLILTDSKHQKALVTFHSARKSAAKLEALKEAFQSRGYMLRDLVALHTANYYEESSVRGTNRSDTYVYEQRKARLNERREQKRGE